MFAAAAPVAALGSSSSRRTVAPTRIERAAILKAFGDPPAASSCLIVRLAASNHNFGTVRVWPSASCQRWAFNGVNVLKRGSSGHWKVVFEASAYRCPVPRIPRVVQRQLDVCA